MDHPSRATQCSRCWNAPWVTLLHRIPHIEPHSAFSRDHRLSEAWESYFLGILTKTDRNRTEEPGGLQSMGSQRVRSDWVTEQTHTYRQKQDNKVMRFHIAHGWPQILHFHTPLFSFVLTLQLCINRSVGILLSKDAILKSKTWACSDFLQPF